jgi:hypothetical protein
VRTRGKGDEGSVTIETFLSRCTALQASKAVELA